MGEKKLLYYIFAITIAIIVLIGYFATYPFIKRINDTKDNLQVKKMDLSLSVQKGIDLKKLSKTYQEYEEQINLLGKMFPKTKDVADYITQIQGAISDSGIALSSVKVATQNSQTNSATSPQLTQLTKNGNFYELPIDIQFIGTYDNAMKFSQTLENLSRFTSIKKANLKTDDKNHPGQLEGSISIVIYVSP